MAKLSWWKRASRWFRGWEIVDSILSLAWWFKAIAGLLVGVLGTAGGVVGALRGSGVTSAVVGALSGVGLAIVIGGIIASRLRALIPDGATVTVPGANGYGHSRIIGPNQQKSATESQIETDDSSDEVSLKQQIAKLENQIGKLEAHRDEQTEEIKRSKENVESLRQENERQRQVFHECRYGYLPHESLETAHDLTEVINEVRRFMPLLRTAHRSAQGMLDSVLQTMRAQDNACGGLLFLFVKNAVHDRCQISYGLLEQSLKAYTDPRLALATYYYLYMQVRVWISRSESVWGFDATMREQRDRWLDDDKKFRGRLAESLELEILVPVGSEIERLNAEHKYPALVE